MNLSERLKLYREACNFSQQQIADQLSVHRATYSYYELGHTEPSVENLVLLARIFGVTPNDLLGFETPGPSVFRDNDIYDEAMDLGFDNDIKAGDLTKEERNLIISFRTLTASQRTELAKTISILSLSSMNDDQ